jgi:hypothetical protein
VEAGPARLPLPFPRPRLRLAPWRRRPRELAGLEDAVGQARRVRVNLQRRVKRLSLKRQVNLKRPPRQMPPRLLRPPPLFPRLQQPQREEEAAEAVPPSRT